MSLNLDTRSIEALLACERPYLVGVRHHSAALARVMPALLDRFAPERLLVELPAELASWLPWLGHPELEAPVALTAVPRDAPRKLGFYPFADFSPELAAVRWAVARGVDVVPCDLPVAHRDAPEGTAPGDDVAGDAVADETGDDASGLLKALLRRTGARDSMELWERLVETPAAGAGAEEIRRAALLFGWAVRAGEGQPSARDRRREAHMRRVVAGDARRTAAVVGSFHAPALLRPPRADGTEEIPPGPPDVVTALIPYTFEQLDERSGYPAGIRDPVWHQEVYAAGDAEGIDAAMSSLAVGVCRRLRRAGHPGSAAAASEVVRMARDLARLRGLAAPGRGELLEALTVCLAQGEVLGLGRAVARAMETVMVGSRRGHPAPGTPRSGLAPHVEDALARLKLPGPEELGDEPRRLRRDPLRLPLDRARVVTLERLDLCGVPYGDRRDAAGHAATGLSRENLTEVWEASWQHGTAAMLEAAATRGATLEQAASGALRSTAASAPDDGVEESAAGFLARLRRAARCGLGRWVEHRLPRLMGPFLDSAGLPELVAARAFVERIRRGHEAGLPAGEVAQWQAFVQPFTLPPEVQPAPLLQAALAAVDALAGSEDLDDVHALLDLVLSFQQQDPEGADLGAGRLGFSLRRLAAEGSPLMQGAALAARLLLGFEDTDTVATALGSWIDAATEAQTLKDLRQRLSGAILMAAPRLAGDLDVLAGVTQRLEALGDGDFLRRLPSLRGGFDVLTPAARGRLLEALVADLPDAGAPALATTEDPEVLAWRLEADEAGRRAVVDLLGADAAIVVPASRRQPEAGETPAPRLSAPTPAFQLSVADRWRLILGQQNDCLPPLGLRAAAALDELYGRGRGEGQDDQQGGGREGSFPSAREWSGELEELFGSDVREDVLAQAAAGGRLAALDELDPDRVTPSVDLLQQVLALKGSLPESRLASLRPLVKRLIDALVEQLASRLQPALTGLTTPRPTRRRTGDLDLGRTVRANLHRVVEDDRAVTGENGSASARRVIVPERLIFSSRARRSLDWHLVLVVDVSGSMEPSVIYSAMMSAIFAGLPALSVDFLAFCTQVLDFTDRVDDPLALLMEVQVGGGTHIGLGLRAARQRLSNPSRSLVVLVSDFEEGVSVGELLGEVRALAATGARLLGVASLNDAGKPRYHRAIAESVAAAGMPVAAVGPLALARWVAEQVK